MTALKELIGCQACNLQIPHSSCVVASLVSSISPTQPVAAGDRQLVLFRRQGSIHPFAINCIDACHPAPFRLVYRLVRPEEVPLLTKERSNVRGAKKKQRAAGCDSVSD